MRERAFGAWVLAWALLCAGPAFAAETKMPPGLTGGWSGMRGFLYELGVGIQVRYVTELAYNARGGKGHALRQAGQLNVGLGLDLEKLAGVKGGTFQFTFTHRNGNNLNADMELGNLQLVQEVYGRGNVGRLTQLWYDQLFWDERVHLKVGRVTMGEDSADFPCDFQNLSFCGAQPGNIVGNYWFNWPVSQWGTRLRVDLKKVAYVQLAAYEVNPRNLEEAFYLGRFNGATGVMLPLELGWNPKFHGDLLEGLYKVGVWYDTSNAPDVLLPDVERQGRYGVYFVARQQLSHVLGSENEAQGLNLFVRLTYADRDTSAQDGQYTAGLGYTGLPGRPDDDVGFALGATHSNGRYITAQRQKQAQAPGTLIPRTEYVGELYYSLHAAPWLVLRPNLQYIRPGGNDEARDILVLGLKGALTL
ncbi:carbohydrate porin [Corallococcus sp. AB049A]|uniref:Carbohydrate porin n=1 Tax=Corallococcus interemptor TaxID=2316720 RepID=A0A3A8PVA0_9BACT|nr:MULTISPECIES: carbohydrate porin [Corallococcus]RKH60397.1 carbohydrate porin [Corallococcus interemptor]RKI66596.1 carbohydrate porin [Corallococcus sp. AB049A]